MHLRSIKCNLHGPSKFFELRVHVLTCPPKQGRLKDCSAPGRVLASGRTAKSDSARRGASEGWQKPITRRLLSFGGCCCCGCMGSKQSKKDQTTYNRAFAYAMAYGMAEYESTVRPVKEELFAEALSGFDAPEIVDIGMGTGPNLPYYSQLKGVRITGIEPNLAMNDFAREAAEAQQLQPEQLRFVGGRAESLPLPDNSMDVAVCTLVLCSVQSVQASLGEIKRVLRPGGKLVFVEHTQSSNAFLRTAQVVLNPLQQLLADGCHLTRDPEPELEPSGLSLDRGYRFFVQGQGLIGPHVAGIATA